MKMLPLYDYLDHIEYCKVSVDYSFKTTNKFLLRASKDGINDINEIIFIKMRLIKKPSSTITRFMFKYMRVS